MYYGRGCSNMYWCTGRTLGGVNKLQVAAALIRGESPGCDTECVLHSMVEILTGRNGWAFGYDPRRINVDLLRTALQHSIPWYRMDDETLAWIRLSSCGDPLNKYLRAASVRLGCVPARTLRLSM